MQKDRNTTALQKVSFLHIVKILTTTLLKSMEMIRAFKEQNKKKIKELGCFVDALLRLLINFVS